MQGRAYVAREIDRRVKGERPANPFWYWDKGNIAIVGRTFAVADLGRCAFRGSRRGSCGSASTSFF